MAKHRVNGVKVHMPSVSEADLSRMRVEAQARAQEADRDILTIDNEIIRRSGQLALECITQPLS